MRRRKALRQIGWGLSGGLLMPSLLEACGPKDPGPEINYSGTVAVVGAGAAGLYVADILHSKGVKVVIYEARDQIGGRIKSLRNQSPEIYPFAPQLGSDFPIELGAQTIIGTDSIMGKIFTDYNLVTTEFLPSGNHFVMDNLAKSVEDWAGDTDFQRAQAFRAGLTGHVGSPQTVQGAVPGDINPRAYGILNGMIGNAYGSSNDVIGIGALAEEETLRSNDGLILTPMSNPMQDVLISRFSNIQSLVQVSTPINSINYSGDPIQLVSKDGTIFEANKVIVTVPVSMLKNGSILFTPGLPGGIIGSLAKIGMGASLRVLLEFKKNFWGDTVAFILGSSNVPEYFSIGVGRGQFNRTLSVTINGEKAAQYSALGDGVVDAILADMDVIYEGQGTEFIRKDVNPPNTSNIFIREDWTNTEYILGGYSYPLAGATNADRMAIGQPVNDKLFFAGEATDITGQAGMVNGALASAERAALEVIASIKNTG